MTISHHLLHYLEEKLSIHITGYEAVSGGSINRTYCLKTLKEKFFIKINNEDLCPDMFSAEAAGLNLIAQTNSVAVPEILLEGHIDKKRFLLLEWLDTRPSSASASALLGNGLSRMHRHSAEYFGLTFNNYMGSLPQTNKKHSTWAAFFINERLHPMVKMATGKKLLNSSDISNFEALYKKLPEIFNEELPSLLHGDLWSGNYLIGKDDKPYLIDPAVTYGNREFDIAMTTLFGGFSKEFYHAYNESFPLAKGWEQRIDLWNLYPLLVHLNLFGTGYLNQVKSCLKPYL